MRLASIASLLVLFLAAGCSSGRTTQIVHARLPDGESVEALRAAFVGNNPGYDLHWFPSTRGLAPAGADRVVFVQGPDGRTDEPGVGDILLLRAGERWDLKGDGALSLLAFTLPEPLPAELPNIVRPDWDPKLTDTPGGCATEGDAYRRILLTWKAAVGPYILHSLNAHRVRINNSFSHYHPVVGGFDEFYLVQQAPPGARLLTSSNVAAIEARDVDLEQAKMLMQSRDLHVGDLVYLPRGTMHRGMGGALVQVISVPGFVPQSEIGVDHHLWAINKQLGLSGDAALPFHITAARIKTVK
ncbi:MAG: hypothetical protein ACI89X_001972 [Planctomycetota bacterium]|jgi:hypothetical protein